MLRREKVNVVFSSFRGSAQISLTEGRPAATFPILQQLNLEAERVEDFYRCNSNVRLVITNKGVVPENHFASAVSAVYDRPIIPSALLTPRHRRNFFHTTIGPVCVA